MPNPLNNATTWMLMVFESDLPAPAKLTACALRTFVNDHTEMAWPSVGRLAHMTSQCNRTVQSHLKLLQERKFLIHNGYSPVGTKRYLIGVEGVQQIHPPATNAPRSKCTPPQEMPERGAGDAPELTNKLTNSTYAPLAEFMWGRIRPLTNQRKYNQKVWANDLRKLVEIDGYSADVVKKIFTAANADDFWKKNILSPAKLRSQFPRLYAEFNESESGQRWL